MANLPFETKLVLESRLEEVGRAEEAVSAAATSCGFSSAECFAVKLALEEALANAIKHGNRSDPEKQVFLEVFVDPDGLRITIEDQGMGFDPEDVPDPTLDENLEKPYGRGVMLMRAYMNEVQFNDLGNAVTMIKYRENSSSPD